MRLHESAFQLFNGLTFLPFLRVSGNTWELGNAGPQILNLLVSVAPGDFLGPMPTVTLAQILGNLGPHEVR